jgi:hypothetical protein
MTQQAVGSPPEPVRDGLGASILGPRNVPLERENLNQWLALTPPELLQAHLNLDDATVNAVTAHKGKLIIVK